MKVYKKSLSDGSLLIMNDVPWNPSAYFSSQKGLVLSVPNHSEKPTSYCSLGVVSLGQLIEVIFSDGRNRIFSNSSLNLIRMTGESPA